MLTEDSFPTNTEIEAKLEKVPREKVILFAARCALRVLPMLAKENTDFDYWNSDKKVIYLTMVFHALAFSFFFRLGSKASAAYAAAVSAFAFISAPASAASVATFTSAAASASASASASVAAFTSAAAAAAAASADAAYHANQSSSNVTAIISDLDNIKYLQLNSPLWPGEIPEEIISAEKKLLAGLEKLGLGVLARQYQAWKKGIFDQRLMRDIIEIPKSTFDSPELIIEYLTAAENKTLKKLGEARVIVIGDSNVGKTCLLNLLTKNKKTDGKTSLPTPGVEIRQEILEINKEKINVNYWDFGGQLLLHPTHQFFMRENCVYLVLVNSRTENSQTPTLNYWLEHIRLYGNGAPTLIVQSKVDEMHGMNTSAQFERSDIYSKYKFVASSDNVHADYFNISNKTGDGKEQLKQRLEKLIGESSILNSKTPAEVFAFKELLQNEQKQNKNYITKVRCEQLLSEAGVSEQQRENAITWMDQLGIGLHFKDIDANLFILTPTWITDIVYHIVWAYQEHNLGGILTIEHLKQFFTNTQQQKGKNLSGIKLDANLPQVSSAELQAVIKLLKHFEMAYDIAPGEYCAPMLLSLDAPSFEVDLLADLAINGAFTFDMPDILPPTLYFRFIVHCGREGYLRERYVWRYGAILTYGRARAKVSCDLVKRQVSFMIYGPNEISSEFGQKLRILFLELAGKYETLRVNADAQIGAVADVPLPDLLAAYQKGSPNVDVGFQTASVALGMGLYASESGELIAREIELWKSQQINAQLIIERQQGYIEATKDFLQRGLHITNQISQTNQQTYHQENHQQVNIQLNINISNEMHEAVEALGMIAYNLPEDARELTKQIELLQKKIAEFQQQPKEEALNAGKKPSLMKSIKQLGEGVKNGLQNINGISDLSLRFGESFIKLIELFGGAG